MASAWIRPLSCPHSQEELLEDQIWRDELGGMSWGGKGGGLRKRPWERDPDVSLRDPRPSLMAFPGCGHPALGAAGGEGSGRGAGGRVPTTPVLPRGAIFKSIFSCLIQVLLSQQTQHDREHT